MLPVWFLFNLIAYVASIWPFLDCAWLFIISTDRMTDSLASTANCLSRYVLLEMTSLVADHDEIGSKPVGQCFGPLA